MAVEMKVKGLTFDPESNMFVVYLSDLENRYALLLGIGLFETNTIFLKLKNTPFYRPMTDDLIRNSLGVFNSEIVKIEVMDLRDNTYYTLIHVKADGKELTIDSRASDAIAIGVGADVPIYVTEEVLHKANTIELNEDMDEDQLTEFLESLDPEDFKYTA